MSTPTPIGLTNPTIADISDQGVIEKRFDGLSIQQVHSYELETDIALEKYEELISDVNLNTNDIVAIDLITPQDGIGRVRVFSREFTTAKRCKIFRQTLDNLPLHTHPDFRPGGGGVYELHPDEVWEGYHIAKKGRGTIGSDDDYSDNLSEFIAKLGNGEWGYSEFCMVVRVEYYQKLYTYNANSIEKHQSFAPGIISEVLVSPPTGGYWFSPGHRANSQPGTQWVHVIEDWWWKDTSWENKFPDVSQDLDYTPLFEAGTGTGE